MRSELGGPDEISGTAIPFLPNDIPQAPGTRKITAMSDASSVFLNGGTGESKSPLSPISDPRPPTDAEYEEFPRLLEVKEGIQTLYADIKEKAGPMDMIIYPASGGDAFPILSTSTLVMIDEARFAEGESSYFLEGVMKAREDPSQAFSFKDFLEDAGIGEATRENLAKMQKESSREINKHTSMGHQYMTVSSSSDHIMRALYSMGVDPLEVTIQSREGGFKLSFELDGKPKQIYYASMHLPFNSSDDEGYRDATQFITQVAEENSVQRTGILVKADIGKISPGLIRNYKPDVLIHDLQALLEEGPEGIEQFSKAFQQYDEQVLGGTDTKYNNIQFGYTDSPTQIVVATRKKDS